MLDRALDLLVEPLGRLERRQRAERVADAIEAGMVFVNVVLADGAELPFGGIKRSGSGRELGRFGADEFVNKKMIRIG